MAFRCLLVCRKTLFLRNASVRGLRTSSETLSFPDYLLSCPETKISTLPNGLRVASEKRHGETACVGVFVDAGSRYETEANNGAAHFLEHLTFKGTHRRAQTDIEISVEDMGAHLNAYTSREQTVYYAKVFKSNISDAIDLLSDMLLHSKLDDYAVNKERDVILREMKEVNKQKEELLLDNLHEVAYQNTGLGWTILGPPKNIMTLSSGDLRNYITTHYTAPRMIVVGVGNVDHQQLIELAQKHFGHLPSKPPAGVVVDADPAHFTGSHKRVNTREDETVHVALAFESAGWISEFSFTLMLIQTMLGRWDRAEGKAVASPVGRELAEEDTSHSFTMFNTFYKDTGLTGFYAVALPNNINNTLRIALKHTLQLCNGVSEDALERAKTQLKANMIMNLDSFSHIFEDIGRQLLVYGRRVTPAELFARIDSISSEDIRRCADTFFNDEDYALSAVGPLQELMSYEEIRELCVAKNI